MLLFGGKSCYLSQPLSLRARNLVGAHPRSFLKSRLNWLRSSNPKRAAISFTLRKDWFSNSSACCNRRCRTYCFGEKDVSALNSRMKYQRERWTWCASSRTCRFRCNSSLMIPKAVSIRRSIHQPRLARFSRPRLVPAHTYTHRRSTRESRKWTEASSPEEPCCISRHCIPGAGWSQAPEVQCTVDLCINLPAHLLA